MIIIFVDQIKIVIDKSTEMTLELGQGIFKSSPQSVFYFKHCIPYGG